MGPDVNAPWRKLYSNVRQASLAAMKVGQKEARPRTANERAFNLLLMATRRDPAFVKPVFNLGVVCEMSERWEDALSFYKTVPSLEQDPRILETANSEVERLKVITALMATPDGRRKRDFDIALVALLDAKVDPVVGADRAESLAKQDRSRWEAPALAAEMYSALEKYAQAAKSLEAATRVAPSDKKASLNAALEIAKAQAKYQELVDSGIKSWEEKKYEDAAKLYQEAWKVDPSHLDTGMDSAVAYLMADQIKQAVAMLSLLLQTDADVSSQKVRAMLKQLVPVSVEAKDALNNSNGGATPAVRLSPADRITKAVGDLASAEVRLIARPTPAFIDEQQAAFESLPDPELISADLAKLSPEGIFDQYQHGVPALPQSSSVGDPLSPTPSAQTSGKDSPSQPAFAPKAEQSRPSTPPDRPTFSLPKYPPSTPKDPDKPVPPPQ
jgi:tetratricopeptide (TPR) repeat protein